MGASWQQSSLNTVFRVHRTWGFSNLFNLQRNAEHVASPSVSVNFALLKPLDQDTMLEVITSTHDYIQQIIAVGGNGLLSDKDDPFIFDEHLGAYIEVRSAHPHLLTWAYLEGVVVAIHNALYLREKYKTSTFHIWDTQVGVIGAGALRKGKHANVLANTTRNVRGNHDMVSS